MKDAPTERTSCQTARASWRLICKAEAILNAREEGRRLTMGCGPMARMGRSV